MKFWLGYGTCWISEQTPRLIYSSVTSLFHYLSSGRSSIASSFCEISAFMDHLWLDLKHRRVTVSLIQVLLQLLCQEMLPLSCCRKTGLCPRPAVCHQLRPPVRQGHWAGTAGGHSSRPLRTTVNLQTIYSNKGDCVRREERHRKQMNKQHQLPGPDLQSPGPRRTFHTKWLQIGFDMPGVERRALTRLSCMLFLGARAS